MRMILVPCLCLAATISLADKPAPVVAIGKPAPDFEILGVDGESFKLSQITGSGKNVALMFDRAHW